MPRGGKRSGSGRPKAKRLTDMAERILAKAKAEQLWLEVIEKARKSGKTYELASILHY